MNAQDKTMIDRSGVSTQFTLSRLRRCLAVIALGTLASAAQAQSPADPYDYARTTSYTYYGSADGAKNGLIKTQTQEPNDAANCVTTQYDYDAYGNRSSTTVSNCAGATGRALFNSRNAQQAYTTDSVSINGTAVAVPVGLFPRSLTNALTQAETQSLDPRFGALLSHSDVSGLSTTVQLDDFGRKLRETRPDGTSTVYWYCSIGAGLDTSANTVGCPTPVVGEAPNDAVMFVQSQARDTANAANGPFVRIYSDRLGREIRHVSESFDGANQPVSQRAALIAVDTAYNAFGAKEIETKPYFLSTGSTATTGSSDRGLTLTSYDALGRPTAVYVTDANGSQTAVSFGSFGQRRAARQTYQYARLAVTSTDDQGRIRKEEKNALGQLVLVTDAGGAQLLHQHDAFGNLVATRDALQNVILMSHDVLGRKVSMQDPDAGTIVYCYDALGQLKLQQNSTMRGNHTVTACPALAAPDETAAAQTGWVTLAYDRLGRQTHRIDPEYASRWYFDRDSQSVICRLGHLCETRTSHGINRRWVYDSAGRLTEQRMDVTSGPSMASAMSYDAVSGRLSTRTYPTGLQVGYSYTARGFTDQLVLKQAATLTPLPATVGGAAGTPVAKTANSLLWQSGIQDAAGRWERQQFGSGVTGRASYDPASGRAATLTAGLSANEVFSHTYGWDNVGNLVNRLDANGDGNTGAVTEGFTHDTLNRLRAYTVAAPAIPGLSRSVRLEYNALGMLLQKSDVGTYTYATQGAASVQPHAVRNVSGAVNSNYVYDLNGNLQTASGGAYRSMAYTSFNLPDSNAGAQGPGGLPSYAWQYDESHARVKEVHADASGTRTTWYLHPDNAGGLSFESETAPGGLLSQRHYLSVEGKVIGVLVSTATLPALSAGQTTPPIPGSLSLAKMEYWHPDHLGSLGATSDHTGVATARYAFDPFGKRRFTDGRYDAAGQVIVDWSPGRNAGTDRGFTGHEQLDDVGLIHMNGRIYDPLLGRFLSADPNITVPDQLQNYDRYAYVMNNPLGMTDPTGLDPNMKDAYKFKINDITYLVAPQENGDYAVARMDGTPIDAKTATLVVIAYNYQQALPSEQRTGPSQRLRSFRFPP